MTNPAIRIAQTGSRTTIAPGGALSDLTKSPNFTTLASGPIVVSDFNFYKSQAMGVVVAVRIDYADSYFDSFVHDKRVSGIDDRQGQFCHDWSTPKRPECRWRRVTILPTIRNRQRRHLPAPGCCGSMCSAHAVSPCR